MKLKYFISGLLIILFSLTASAQKRTIAGVQFPSTVKVGSSTTIYNGGGLREKYTLDLYAGALYLKRPSKSASKIIMNDAPMAIRIVIVSTKVSKDKFNTAVKEGFENSNTGKSTKEDLNLFMTFYSDEFKINDVLIISYQPGKGVSFSKNGKQRGIIKGLAFKQALFGIWLGDKPADSSLKDDMLGKI